MANGECRTTSDGFAGRIVLLRVPWLLLFAATRAGQFREKGTGNFFPGRCVFDAKRVGGAGLVGD
jgi:hypothetical protein